VNFGKEVIILLVNQMEELAEDIMEEEIIHGLQVVEYRIKLIKIL
jgi:hypothetical protein